MEYRYMAPPFDYDFKDKGRAAAYIARYYLNRTLKIFEWRGLPDTIPGYMLELMLQWGGFVGIIKYRGKFYAVHGGLGGEPDMYYNPTILTVANPALNLSADYKIAREYLETPKDGAAVLVPNDSQYIGLKPLLSRYSTMQAETELSMFLGVINTRIISLISAPDDTTQAAALKYLKDIANGELGVIAENAFLDGVRVQPYATHSGGERLTDLIEINQYLKASLYNEIGLNANYNMKRESINSAEAQLNNDALKPLIDDMLECRQRAGDMLGRVFGMNIKVEYNSAWADNEKELEAAQEAITEPEAAESEEQGGAENEETT